MNSAIKQKQKGDLFSKNIKGPKAMILAKIAVKSKKGRNKHKTIEKLSRDILLENQETVAKIKAELKEILKKHGRSCSKEDIEKFYNQAVNSYRYIGILVYPIFPEEVQLYFHLRAWEKDVFYPLKIMKT